MHGEEDGESSLDRKGRVSQGGLFASYAEGSSESCGFPSEEDALWRRRSHV